LHLPASVLRTKGNGRYLLVIRTNPASLPIWLKTGSVPRRSVAPSTELLDRGTVKALRSLFRSLGSKHMENDFVWISNHVTSMLPRHMPHTRVDLPAQLNVSGSERLLEHGVAKLRRHAGTTAHTLSMLMVLITVRDYVYMPLYPSHIFASRILDRTAVVFLPKSE
jgi:hypothetical protein